MIFYLLKTNLFQFSGGIKNVIIKIFQLFFVIFTLLVLGLAVNENIISLRNSLPQTNLYFSLAILILFALYKYRLNEHKSLLILPVRHYKLTLFLVFNNFFKFQTLYWGLLSYFIVLLNLPSEKLPLKIILIILSTFLFSTSFINSKLAISSKSINFLDYISLVYLIFLFLIPNNDNYSILLQISIIFIIISFIRTKTLIRKTSGNLIQASSFLKYNLKNNLILNKEIKLLLNNKKGRGLVVTSFIIFITFFILSIYSDSTMDFYIFLCSSGFLMAEYLQYILSWDYKNIGLQFILPINSEELIASKLKAVRIIIFISSLISYITISPDFHSNVVLLFFIFNFFSLPHLYMLITLSCFKNNMFIDKSFLNINYYQRPIKLITIVGLTYLIQIIIIRILPVNQIYSFLVWIIPITVLILTVFNRRIIHFYSKQYKTWLQKFINFKEDQFVF